MKIRMGRYDICICIFFLVPGCVGNISRRIVEKTESYEDCCGPVSIKYLPRSWKMLLAFLCLNVEVKERLSS